MDRVAFEDALKASEDRFNAMMPEMELGSTRSFTGKPDEMGGTDHDVEGIAGLGVAVAAADLAGGDRAVDFECIHRRAGSRCHKAPQSAGTPSKQA